MSLDARPHHDGSERHVSTLEPQLGEPVTVWLRVPHADPADAGVRCARCRDGEPHFDARRHRPHDGARRRGGAPTSSCTTPSRTTASCSTAARPGTASSTAPASTSAPCPTRRTSACRPTRRRRRGSPTRSFYQVFPDRFASSAARPRRGRRGRRVGVGRPGRHRRAPRRAPGVRRRPAGRSRRTSTTSPSLGVGGLYLTPFFPAPSSHRYDADTFEHVDPIPRWRRRPRQPGQGVPQPRHPRHRRPHDQPRRCRATSGSAPPRPTPTSAGGRVLLLPAPPRRLRGVVRRADRCPSSTCATTSSAAACSTGPTRSRRAG